ncbi:MAG: biotin transporter BioY [candidate division Zixibacteria bacterium]|nr:biotin transporter BioY [candidate division Zixibacteria bacterium]
MQLATLADTFAKARLDAFRWRYNAAVAHKIGLALSMAVLTGLLAQVRFYLPWTPIPVTGQTFAVLMAGVLLGRHWGGISMALYAALGAFGIPWFAGWSGGLAVLAGPTGGYILGFIVAALFLGHVTDKYVKSRNFLPMAVLMSIATVALIFVPGLIQLAIWTSVVQGEAVSLGQLMAMGLTPFLAGAVVKVAAAASLTKAVTPKSDYSK